MAQKDNDELIEEVKNREEIVNTTFKKLEGLNQDMEELRNKTKKL